ncbi:phage Gp37/Gp68 family protein [Agrobacterium sp. AGB01]|uniref:phage Gp37/Gp68 family protein n=1 Tax=Agrobacterium sp. AGB01 TaxID=2769302 RepID=UPI001785DEB0|nr:phage Gp37/Gp68 family protein [Agrobacterium sp. AGB01]MBD9390163.1 phage Gp37/Gp68 family protein [Agrobacterium sp. AGB01]
MAQTTSIEWTDATWNPITGCSVVSPGCTNCYAMKLAGTRLKHHETRKGLTKETKAGPVWNGEVRLNKKALYQPTDWKKPRMIFVCAHGDLFAENVPDEWILDVLTVIASNPQHTFQVLTKRADRMRDFMSNDDLLEDIYANWSSFSGAPREAWSWPLHNLWLGVSVEDQARANERLFPLLDTPAAIRWVSCEPLLGSLDLTDICQGSYFYDALRGTRWHDDPDRTNPSQQFRKGLDWVVAGGESGPSARPMHPDWARWLRDQCAAADVAFFFKQWGNWISILDRNKDDPDYRADYTNRFNERQPDIRWLNYEAGSGFHGNRFHVMQRVSKASAGRLLDGVAHDAFPKIERIV